MLHHTLPLANASSFYNVGVAQLEELAGGLLAPVSTATVDVDALGLVRQGRNLLLADGLVRDADGTGDVPLGKLLMGADIQQDEVLLRLQPPGKLIHVDSGKVPSKAGREQKGGYQQ